MKKFVPAALIVFICLLFSFLGAVDFPQRCFSLDGAIHDEAVPGLITPQFYDPLAGTTGHDSTDAISRADAAVQATGLPGTVWFPPGVYMVSGLNQGVLTTYSGNPGSVTIKMRDGANAPAVIQTAAFSTLTGTTSSGGMLGGGLSGIIIDGNRANNRGGNGVAYYGRAFAIQNCIIQNAPAAGLYTEYGGEDAFSSTQTEASILNVEIRGCGGTGWQFEGPHDSTVVQARIFSNGGWGLDCKMPLHAFGLDTWLNFSGGIWVNTGNGGLSGADIIGSTASGYGMLIDSGTGGCAISAGNFGGPIGLQINSYNHAIQGIVANTTTAGIKFGQYGAARLDLSMWANSGFWFDVSSGGGGTSAVTVQSYSTAGTLFNGTPSGQWGNWTVTGLDAAHRYRQDNPEVVNTGISHANLLSVPNGTEAFCADCRNFADDAAAVGSVAAPGGHGAKVIMIQGSWRTMN